MLRAAQQIAAAIGYIGLTNFDRVGAATFDSTVRNWFPPARGRGAGTSSASNSSRVRPGVTLWIWPTVTFTSSH